MKVTCKQKIVSICLVLLMIVSIFPILPKQEVEAADGNSFADITGANIDGEALVEHSKQWLGVPYVNGGKNPEYGSLDCNGFVLLAYKTYLKTMSFSKTGEGGYAHVDNTPRGTIRNALEATRGPGKYDFGVNTAEWGHYFVDSYGFGSLNLDAVADINYYLMNGRPGTKLTKGVACSEVIPLGSEPRDGFDSYTAGDIIIFYNDANGTQLNYAWEGKPAPHMGIYAGNGNLIHANASAGQVSIDKVVNVHSGDLKSIKSYRIFRMSDEPTGSLKLQKQSAKPEYTNNNSNYSLAGAEYTVYEDRGMTKEIDKLITKADGSTNVIDKLKAGTYYVKETKASKGFVKDPKVYNVKVEPSKEAVVISKEIPLDDPVSVAVKKQDKATGKAMPQGDASLALAEFTFKFYLGDYAENVDPATQGVKPDRTWVLRTNGNGELYLNSGGVNFTYKDQFYSYKVSGDEFYLDPLGNPTLPLGTVTIQETKAPEGYFLDDTVHVRKIEQGTGENVETYNIPIVDEQVMLNKFKIEKFNTDGEQSEILTPEPGATFTAIAQKYINQYGSFDEAIKHTADYGVNEWTTATTDLEGKATSGDLAYGEYLVKQIGASPEKELLKEEIHLTIKDSESEPVTYKINNVSRDYYVKIIKVDAQTGEQIVLTGASFKIRNQATGEYITQKIGSVIYDTFKTTAETKGELSKGMFYADHEEQGTATTPLKLKAGTYLLEEVASPTGYKILDKPIEFDIKEQNVTTTDQDNDEYIEVVAENTPQYGELVIYKQGEQFKEWVNETTTLQVQAEGKTTTVTKEVPRAGEVLTIRRNWTETKEVEELVDVPAETEPTEQEGTEPITKQQIVKKTIEEQHEDVSTVITDENGQYHAEIDQKGTYTVFDKNGVEVANTEIAEGGTGQLNVQLAPETRTEEIKEPGEVSDKIFTYKKAVFEKDYLPGAEFSLTAKEQIKSFDGKTVFYEKNDKLFFAQKDIMLNGKLVYRKGEVITIPALPAEIMSNEELVKDVVVTENEALKIHKIPLGEYLLTEEKAPVGYVKDETVREFSFTPQEQTILADLKETEPIENARQKLHAYVTKQIVGQDNFDSIVIGLYTGEEVLGLAKDSLVGAVKPDQNGAILLNDLPKGSYYFKEISTKDGYILKEDEFELTLTPDQNAQTEDKIEKVKEPIVNEPKTKTVTIVKQDKATGKALASVEFKLYKVLANGTKEVMTDRDGNEQLFVTDENGKIILENLPFGNYFLEEVKAKDGYVKEEQGTNLSVAEDGQDETIINNESIRMAISKIDKKTGVRIVGAKLRLVDQDGNVLYLDENKYLIDKEHGRPAEWITDGTDFVVYGLHADQVYYVEEVQAPEGYHKNETVIDLVATANKGNQLTEVPNMPYEPEGKTKAFVGNGLKEAHALAKVNISDQLTYKDLIEGREYKAMAKLVLADDPSTVIAEGEINFIPQTKDGEVVVPFGEVDLSTLSGKTLVVFENVIDLKTNLVVIKEEQPDNKEQQIEVKEVEVGTSAKYTNDKKEADPVKELTVIDTVEYKGLIVGESYTMKGKLVDKENPETVIAENEVTFTAKTTDGTIDLTFRFDGTKLQGKSLVVFEYLYYGEDLIGQHENPEDEGQTVKVSKEKTIQQVKPITNDNRIDKNIYLVGGISGLSFALEMLYLALTKKKE